MEVLRFLREDFGLVDAVGDINNSGDDNGDEYNEEDLDDQESLTRGRGGNSEALTTQNIIFAESEVRRHIADEWSAVLDGSAGAFLCIEDAELESLDAPSSLSSKFSVCCGNMLSASSFAARLLAEETRRPSMRLGGHVMQTLLPRGLRGKAAWQVCTLPLRVPAELRATSL